jgi:hypothetical protein
MTEAEWLSATDPTPMLEFLRGKASDRKLRLFACSCCQRAWDLFADPATRAAVEFSEEHADRGVRGRRGFPAIRKAAHLAFRAMQQELSGGDPAARTTTEAKMFAAYAVEGLTEPVQVAALAINLARALRLAPPARFAVDGRPEQEYQAILVREVFGNPFHPIPLNPTWQTSTVLALAQGIYQDRAFDRLPILADALLDSGCDNPDLLNHLRSEGPHTRGCFAIDLLLNRE